MAISRFHSSRLEFLRGGIQGVPVGLFSICLFKFVEEIGFLIVSDEEER